MTATNPMTATYQSMQVDHPGAAFRLVEQELATPGPGHVRVTVEAVGICHSDAMFIEGHMPGVTFPLVAGHEIAGRVDAIGDEVEEFDVGQRVAVGWFGGNCGHCNPCRAGDAIHCTEMQIPGLSYPGGFAEDLLEGREDHYIRFFLDGGSRRGLSEALTARIVEAYNQHTQRQAPELLPRSRTTRSWPA